MQEATEENQNMFIDRYLEEGIKIDYWWMDAGWYPFKGGWWNTGTWEPDPQRFPHGIRGVADHAHAKGVKILVWFEPERVTAGTWLYEKHPEWLLSRPDDNQRLLNLGKPEAFQWLVQTLDKFINEQGVDVYRTDFNISPLRFWRTTDAPDRQGITENKYVSGFLGYFDALRRLHPNILFDNCASGGRRNDLETLRRALPLDRSDFGYEPTGMQNLTYGISLWIPYFGAGVSGRDAYTFRSQMTPSLGFVWDVRRKYLNYPQLRQFIAQWRQMNGYYYGDFYPLIPFDPSDTVWMAWQYDRPESGEGVVQAFRRPDCAYDSARLKLQGLDPAATYTLTDVDHPGAKQATGRELMEQGLSVTLKNRSEAAIILYKQLKTTR
jgi:alpha-galactosidase